jgi:hypothetical protein
VSCETVKDNVSNDDTNISFTSIYLETCAKRKEPPTNILVFEQLDEVINDIFAQINENNKTSELVKLAFSNDRICMVVPIDIIINMYDLPDDYYDSILDDGTKIYYSTLLCDIFRTDCIKKLYEPEQNVELTQWKLKRIEKVLNIGWVEYKKQYIVTI